jgi:hypothetical protein
MKEAHDHYATLPFGFPAQTRTANFDFGDQRVAITLQRNTWTVRHDSNVHFHPLPFSWFVAKGVTDGFKSAPVLRLIRTLEIAPDGSRALSTFFFAMNLVQVDRIELSLLSETDFKSVAATYYAIPAWRNG